MEPDRSTENDAALNRLLHEWNVRHPLPPRFHDGVWRRIAASSGKDSHAASVWQSMRTTFARLAIRPAWIASSISLCVLVGLTVGWKQAHDETTRLDAALGARYVQTVDPYQAQSH